LLEFAKKSFQLGPLPFEATVKLHHHGIAGCGGLASGDGFNFQR
jgi:hypothetical protein